MLPASHLKPMEEYFKATADAAIRTQGHYSGKRANMHAYTRMCVVKVCGRV